MRRISLAEDAVGGWMSGGHYDYAYRSLESLAGRLREDVRKYLTDGEEDGQEHRVMPLDVLAHMNFVADQLDKMAEAAHDIEWLMDQDYGYDTLRERCKSWALSEHLRQPGHGPCGHSDDWQRGFAQGISWACAEVIRQHDQGVIAKDVFVTSGVAPALCVEEDLVVLRREMPDLPKGVE
jgi:hypothetical protein